jgi:adenylyltransferase/sulfurtransferase
VALTEAERERYARQIALGGWGDEAQLRLREARAIVVGAGALGSPVATYLAAAGVGVLGIVDAEAVGVADPTEEPLHWSPDLGAMKADSAAAKLALLNRECQIETYPVRIEALNAAAIVAGADVVADCSSDSETTTLVNDSCCAEGVPFAAAGLSGPDAWVASVRPGSSACLRCAGLASAGGGGAPGGADGRIGAVAGVAGSIQALEALKLLTGFGEPLLDRVLRLEATCWSPVVEETTRRPDCLACGEPAATRQSG